MNYELHHLPYNYENYFDNFLIVPFLNIFYNFIITWKKMYLKVAIILYVTQTSSLIYYFLLF